MALYHRTFKVDMRLIQKGDIGANSYTVDPA